MVPDVRTAGGKVLVDVEIVDNVLLTMTHREAVELAKRLLDAALEVIQPDNGATPGKRLTR